VPEAVDDLGIQPAVVWLGRHLQTKNIARLDVAKLVTDVRMVSHELVNDHRLADVAIAVEQHAGHAAAWRMPQQVLHSRQRLTCTCIRDPLGHVQPGDPVFL